MHSLHVDGVPAAIDAKNLSKSFPKSTRPSVSDLSFSIPQGETVAFMGQNGAGKSTTIKMLCGILSPSKGEAQILGYKAGSIEANQQLGLVFGTRSQLYFHMTVLHCLDLSAEIYYLTGEQKRSRIRELSDAFGITSYLSRRIRTLSLGERMRCEIVAALLHKPRVLLADEPTIGLDVLAKNSLRILIKNWQAHEKTTLMLTSHDLSDVEALCSRCILIDQGTLKYDGPLGNLKGDLRHIRKITAITSDPNKGLLTNASIFTSKVAESEFMHIYEFSLEKNQMSDCIYALTNHYGETLQDLGISEVSIEEVLGAKYASQK
jgi:ABC-2 type transport system ATP-binding protein